MKLSAKRGIITALNTMEIDNNKTLKPLLGAGFVVSYKKIKYKIYEPNRQQDFL